MKFNELCMALMDQTNPNQNLFIASDLHMIYIKDPVNKHLYNFYETGKWTIEMNYKENECGFMLIDDMYVFINILLKGIQ
jgi:hypothetical protein